MGKEQLQSIANRCRWRGYEEHEKTWIYGYITRVLSNNKVSIEHWHVSADTVGQYAGRNDKNGNEIYEGDILLDENDNMCIVIYRDGEWILDYMGRMPWSLRDTSPEECQVIGNIHDNPELLNK